MRFLTSALPILAAGIASPASAELPEPVRAMIEAAIATGDEAKIATVIELARQTNPEDGEEIDAIWQTYQAEQAAIAAAQAEQELAEIRSAGLFENWSGKGEFGAFRATGNTSSTGLTAGLSLRRDGIDWRHKLRGRADFQRNNGVTSREQYFLAYEPNFSVSDSAFVYGLLQFERDRLQGFSARYVISGGIGYQIVEKPELQLSAKTGPALRVTELVDGTSETRIAGLLGLDFDWRISDRLKLTHDTNAVAETGGSATLLVDSSNTSLNLVTGLNAKVSDKITTRFSYTFEYDSNPPEGANKTDTQSRVTLIYDF